jgi:toxin YoeB
VTWRLVYTKRAQKGAKQLAASNLKNKALTLLNVLREEFDRCMTEADCRKS